MSQLRTIAVAGVALPTAMAFCLWAVTVFAETHGVPLFSAASMPWQSFVRVINHDSEAGIVRIRAENRRNNLSIWVADKI